MTMLSEDLKFQKQEKDRIISEINDLQSRIIVASGRRDRNEVNNCRERINFLKRRLNEASLRIADLEKKIKNISKGQIQIIPNSDSNLVVKNGDIAITDTVVFDRGESDIGGEVIQTVTRTVERKTIFKNGKPVSCEETFNESITTRKLENRDSILIESSILD